jgi:uncharacterized cupin superfamily protein
MDRTPVKEAPLLDTPAGRQAQGEGWYVTRLGDGPALDTPNAGHAWTFEPAGRRFPHFGVNVHVLKPGEPNGKYHAEEGQEAFLVLAGEALLIVEGEERRLRQWDFFHCEPWTAHIVVGAGDGPCAILMVGARNAGDGLVYPRNEIAARFGASAAEDTSSGAEAYADWPPVEHRRKPWPPEGLAL